MSPPRTPQATGRLRDHYRLRRLYKITAATLAPILFLTLGTPLAAQAQEPERIYQPAPSDYASDLPGEYSDVVGEAIDESVRDAIEGADPAIREGVSEGLREAGEAPADLPDGAIAAALPTGEAKSAVEPSRISLPSAEGSVEGMGESFAPVLSSGTATFSVPISLPAGRAGVQPSLGLSYASSGGNSCVGFGWSMGAPFIVRQSDRGLPRYDDSPSWTPREDRFYYNGGQELVPVDSAAMALVDRSGVYPASAADLPDGVTASWQQYRARVEGGFMRFFRRPDFRGWVVQGKDGTRFDFGMLGTTHPPDLDDRLSLQTEADDGSGLVYAWRLTRMSDAHGSTVYYRYIAYDGQRYLRDIHYLSPTSCEASSPVAQRDCTDPLADYGARVALTYEDRPDVFATYTSGWRVAEGRRLRGATVTAADDVGTRTLVRRYHFAYQPVTTSFHSLLQSVQVEGRPDTPTLSGDLAHDVYSQVAEGSLGSSVVGRLLPPMVFDYTTMPAGGIPGFGTIDDTMRAVTASPNVSVDAARADLFDVNTDGLPDLVVTDPARYRTADGDPAVGVFFNGFVGAGAEPAGAAGIFSDPVSVAIPSGLSSTLNLGNANIVPMDVDGDGRSDLLHMPRLDRYGWFTPVRVSDAVAGDSVSPADQGWRFAYGEVQLATGTDPLVDFVRDGTRYRVMDVDGDHLIDIVRTTGTVMQTWRNLGWLPGGEGKFGRALPSSSSPSGYVTDSAPYETCLLHDGLPVDFADPEVRIADMNGDGLQDLVKMRRGRIVYWPGRGVTSEGAPVFGIGDRDCARGEGSGRAIVMATAPPELNPDLSGVFLADVNGDGASDVVQVRFREVDTWFNRAGEGFTARTIIASPMAPDFAPRIRFADIDGSGTTDLVYGNASNWLYLDLMGGQQPRLLRQVDNGLGATTTLTYGSSAEDMTADLADADSVPGTVGIDTFTWSRVGSGAEGVGSCDDILSAPGARPGASDENDGRCVYRSGGSPVLSTVVRSVSTTDNFTSVGREANVTETRFAYHDGYYEGIEQEFRGFGAADAEAVGDVDHPTAYTRTHFRQGRRPSDIAGDRLADNPYEALKGRQWLSEVFDASGVYLSSSHATITIRPLIEGLDGRLVSYAYVSRSDELRYGTAGFVRGVTTIPLPALELQEGGGPSLGGTSTVLETSAVPARGADFAHITSTTPDVDNLGQVREQVALGRVGVDDEIHSHSTPALVNGAAWIWRTASTFVDGGSSGTADDLGETTNEYNEVGDLVLASQVARHSGTAYVFGGDSNGAENFGTTPTTQTLVASTSYDPWGNPLATCAGGDIRSGNAACVRFGAVEYDASYSQLPTSEHLALTTDRSRLVDCGSVSSQFCTVAQTASWDRGFGALLSATDPNGQTASVRYDGLGRMTAVFPPTVAGDACSTQPTQTFRYDLVPEGRPLSLVTTTQILCTGQNPQAMSVVDGLGRPRASGARTGDGGASSRQWEQSGISTFTARGTPRWAFDNAVIDSDPPTPTQLVARPSSPHVAQRHDAFGRALTMTERDGSVSEMRYGALTTESFDAVDTGLSGAGATPQNAEMFVGTSAVSEVDGHGRATVQRLHQVIPQGMTHQEEFHWLRTSYRIDGAVTGVRRQRTDSVSGPVTDEIARTFTYDSLGRRLGTTDPDSDDPSGAAATSGWRYLHNRVGDLIAVRDARGCGQNFYYDAAGRLTAEDYVECSEASTPDDYPLEALPSGSFATPGATPSVEPDAVYFFDAAPTFASAMGVPANPQHIGRATGATDRGQRSAVAYDSRGRAVWTARQMAILPDVDEAADAIASDAPTLADGTRPATAIAGARLFDTAHTYVSTSGYDRLDRATDLSLPADPDWGGTGAAPTVSGRMDFQPRGMPANSYVGIDGAEHRVARLDYDIYRRLSRMWVGAGAGGAHRWVGYDDATYDVRHRPTRMRFTRTTASGMAPELSAVTVPRDQRYTWDVADNLIDTSDTSPSAEWPDEQKPMRQEILHDALYRVIGIDYAYRAHAAWTAPPGPAVDWRDEQSFHESGDPMRRRPAEMVSALPSTRPMSMQYEFDWLGNQTLWNDDQSAFYERSLTTSSATDGIVNGYDVGGRPGSIVFASIVAHLGAIDPLVDRGGFVELEYGVGGNVVSTTVRGQCRDTALACSDPGGTSVGSRASALRAACACDVEQHYQYRYDELNRLSEARRYDRGTGRSTWELEVRQQYRYDAGNVRMVKRTLDGFTHGAGQHGRDGVERAALYVYPGDFERRGLTANSGAGTYDASTAACGSGSICTETQYMVAGTRLVWKADASGDAFGGIDGTFEPDARLTMALPDLLQSTTVVLDLFSGALLERGTYLPNGGRETLRTSRDGGAYGLEPTGFTGKEGDDEVGLVYFGERYLMPHLGRWATPDPLQVHAGGGGEFGNSYHYVSGNLLQARDPDGLDGEDAGLPAGTGDCADCGPGHIQPTANDIGFEAATNLAEAAVAIETAVFEANYSIIRAAGDIQRDLQSTRERVAATLATFVGDGHVELGGDGLYSVNFESFRRAVPQGFREYYSRAGSDARRSRDIGKVTSILEDLTGFALIAATALTAAKVSLLAFRRVAARPGGFSASDVAFGLARANGQPGSLVDFAGDATRGTAATLSPAAYQATGAARARLIASDTVQFARSTLESTGGRLRFNLTGVDTTGALVRGSAQYGSVTSHELRAVLSDPFFAGKTSFYRNGREVTQEILDMAAEAAR